MKVKNDGGVQNLKKEEPKVTAQKVDKKIDISSDRGAVSKTGLTKMAGDLFKAKLNTVASNVTKTANTVTANVAKTSSVTPQEQQQIDEGVNKVLDAYNKGEGNATVELANQLRGKSADYQAEFMKKLNETAGVNNVTNLLKIAGGELPHHISDARPSDSDKQVIAQALGNAFDKGALGQDFIQKALENESKLLPPGADYLGEIIGKSNSRGLKEAFFDQATQMFDAKSGGRIPDTSGFNSAAAKAIAGDPQLLQKKLAELNKKGELENFIKSLDPKKYNVPYYEEQNNALAKIVSGAANIQPPTAEVLTLFKTTAENFMGGDYNDRYRMSEAMTKLYTGGHNTYEYSPFLSRPEATFHSNAEFFLMELSKYGTQADGKPADANQALALSKFFANTAFNDEFEGRDLVNTVTQREITKLQDALKNYPNIDERTKELIDKSTHINPNSNETPKYQVQEQLAFRLGRIIGSVFQGFEQAVQNRNADNKAIDSAVDTVFKLIPVDKAVDIIASKIPGASAAEMVGLSPDKALEYGKNKLKEWLHKQDLNDNRETVYRTLMEIAATFTPDFYDEFSGGYENVAGIVRDLTKK